MTDAGILVILPCGLTAGGVTSWAVRLVNALCPDRPCGLVLHRAPANTPRWNAPIDPRVRLFDLALLKRLQDANGDIRPFARAYRDSVLTIGGGGPVVLLPTQLGDCFGACAELTRDLALDVRVIGWAHSDNSYDSKVIGHYEPALSAVVGVSGALCDVLREQIPARAADVRHIPSGVEIGPERATILERGPIRIIYTGRMEESVKRTGALIAMSDELAAGGRKHTLTLVGDGPAAPDIDRAIAERPAGAARTFRRVPGASPERVRELLRESDIFVLASRYEGLSVSMLEAMSESCCCIVPRDNSGAPEVIEHGRNGILVGTEETAPEMGRRLAEQVALLCPTDIARMGREARRTVEDRYSIAAHARAVGALVERVVSDEPRRWPPGRKTAFTSAPGQVGSGTVPDDADTRLRLLMNSLKGRTIAVHGTGRHSIELSHVLREYLPEIGAFIDDDPGRQGEEFLGRPVMAPDVVGRIGATDVVISSHLHQNEIWSRRNVYERQGLRVHRLYA